MKLILHRKSLFTLICWTVQSFLSLKDLHTPENGISEIVIVKAVQCVQTF